MLDGSTYPRWKVSHFSLFKVFSCKPKHSRLYQVQVLSLTNLMKPYETNPFSIKFDQSKIRPIRCRPLFIESFLILSGLKISSAWEFVSTSVAANQIKDVEALLCLDKRLRMEGYFRTKDPLCLLWCWKILKLVSFTCECGSTCPRWLY